jgi:hypothetical protein
MCDARSVLTRLVICACTRGPHPSIESGQTQYQYHPGMNTAVRVLVLLVLDTRVLVCHTSLLALLGQIDASDKSHTLHAGKYLVVHTHIISEVYCEEMFSKKTTRVCTLSTPRYLRAAPGYRYRSTVSSPHGIRMDISPIFEQRRSEVLVIKLEW